MATATGTAGTTPIETVLIYGSTRAERMCDRVADWIATHVAGHDGFKLQRIDPADMPRNRHDRAPDPARADAVSRRMMGADAFIIVTPEYNHGYPAPLKALIDNYTTEWQAKPVAFVSYGGISGGIVATEQLRTVLGWLDAVPIRDGVILPHVWSQIDDDGRLAPPQPAERAAAVMLARLRWWAAALRDARSTTPYS